MSCNFCKRFSLATAHLSTLKELVEGCESTVTEFVVHDKDKDNGVCLTFKLNDIPYKVIHDNVGFLVCRNDVEIFNFVRWECNKCGMVYGGKREEMFSPFQSLRLELVKGEQVVANYPSGELNSTNLIYIRLPGELSSEMTLSSFGSIIKTNDPALDMSLVCNGFTPLAMLMIPLYLQTKESVTSGKLPDSIMSIHNIISLQDSRVSVIMGSYAGCSITFYVTRTSSGCELYAVTSNAEAELLVVLKNKNMCHITGTIKKEKIDVIYEQSNRKCFPTLQNNEFGIQLPGIRWTFSGRVVLALVL